MSFWHTHPSPLQKLLLAKMADGPFRAEDLRLIAEGNGCASRGYYAVNSFLQSRRKAGEIICNRQGMHAVWKETPK